MSSGSLAVTGIALALGVLVAIASIPVVAAVVNFPDPGLEAVIRAEVWRPTGDIYNSDLFGLTSLDASSQNITNLEGIQHCVDLTWLALEDNQIVDISKLSGLTKLTVLGLCDNQIADISPLVNNSGLGAGDSVDLRHNCLDLTPGSPDMMNIHALEGRGVQVDYRPQLVVVTFLDPGLEDAIRSAIGKPTGCICDDLTKLTFHWLLYARPSVMVIDSDGTVTFPCTAYPVDTSSGVPVSVQGAIDEIAALLDELVESL